MQPSPSAAFARCHAAPGSSTRWRIDRSLTDADARALHHPYGAVPGVWYRLKSAIPGAGRPPPNEVVVHRRSRHGAHGYILQTLAEDRTTGAPVVHPRHAADLGWQQRLNSGPLLVSKLFEVHAHVLSSEVEESAPTMRLRSLGAHPLSRRSSAGLSPVGPMSGHRCAAKALDFHICRIIEPKCVGDWPRPGRLSATPVPAVHGPIDVATVEADLAGQRPVMPAGDRRSACGVSPERPLFALPARRT